MPEYEITQEELQAELDAMQASGNRVAPSKRIDKKVKSHRNTKIIIVFVIAASLLLSMFVLISNLAGELAKDGYIIKIKDSKEFYKGETPEDYGALQLAFDPTFDEKYQKLIGLGYGETTEFRGGSLFSSINIDETMFEHFKDLVENKTVADKYEKDEGSANFDQFYANKYYIKNVGTKAVYYRLNIEINQNNKNALDAARFMIVTGEADTGYDYKILATPNKETGEGEMAAYRELRTATSLYEYFTDPNKNSNEVSSNRAEDAWICDNLVKNEENGFYNYFSCERSATGEIVSGEMYKLEPGESICYTICIWFEGSDPDHNNSILGGGIEFSINYETEEYLVALYKEKQKQEKENK